MNLEGNPQDFHVYYVHEPIEAIQGYEDYNELHNLKGMNV